MLSHNLFYVNFAKKFHGFFCISPYRFDIAFIKDTFKEAVNLNYYTQNVI